MPSKLKLATVIGLSLAALAATPAFGFRGGAPAGFSGSMGDSGFSCLLCHGEMPGTGMIEILGAPANYEANGIYTLTVRVSDPDKLGAGFQLAAEDSAAMSAGDFTIIDSNTQFADGLLAWVTHTGAGVNESVFNWAAMGNSFEYTVEWQAPSSDVGPITFYAAGNAINNDFTSAGDHAYITNVTSNFNDCPWDLTGSGSVGSADLGALLGQWGDPYGSSELAALLGSWGPCPK